MLIFHRFYFDSEYTNFSLNRKIFSYLFSMYGINRLPTASGETLPQKLPTTGNRLTNGW